MPDRAEAQTAKVFYIVTIIYMMLIFYASGQSDLDQPGILEDMPSADKIEHFSEFFVLGALMFLSFHYTQRAQVKGNAWVLALMGAVIYACTDELHQYFIPGRTPSFLDLLTDTAGVALACFLGAMVTRDQAPVTETSKIKLKGGMLDSEE